MKDNEKLTPEETVKALRCCVDDFVICSCCPARALPDCATTVKLRAAELLEKRRKAEK